MSDPYLKQIGAGSISVRFQELKTSRNKSGKCPGCKKRVKRSKTFLHTVSPFNKTKNGFTKTEGQVWKDVNEEADKWKPDFRHEKC